MNQQVFIGKNAVESWLVDVQAMAPKHCFVVRGHHSFETCGGRDIITQLQKATSCLITEYEDFSVNPKYEEAEIGREKLLQSNADLIVAIGGGSVLDMAKLIRHLAAEQGHIVSLHAIPTTAGTGAEATHFAVAYIDGKKQSIAADDVLPDVAVVYPPLTYSNSTYQTACAGFDAVAQAIESFWAKGATDESRAYSVKALGLLWKQLPQLIQTPTDELRDQVAEGAYYAGKAINISTTTAPHAFSYAFTSHYGYPHGHAVALTFPFFMQLNGTKELYDLLGVGRDNALQKTEEYIEALGLSLQLESTIDIKSTLQEVNLQRLSNNPIETTQDIISKLEFYMKSKQVEDLSKYNPEGSTLRRAQQRMLSILVEIDKICRKHKIDYWLDGGSLLGAIRHHGFIPWDDDLDISVMRKDFPRLRKALIEELPENLVYQDRKTDFNCPIIFAKVRDKHSLYHEPGAHKMKEKGIFVDIFPNEKVPSMWWKRIIDYPYGHCIRGIHNFTNTKDKILSYMVFPFAWTLVQLTRFVNLFIPSDKIAFTYGWQVTYNNYSIKDVFPVTYVPFENIQAPVPHNHEIILTRLFGDYMQIPPEEKRKVHSTKIEFYDE